MTFEQTRFRGDLVVLRQEAREGVHFVVKDPATGRFFRLGEAEFYIIQQLDGETPHSVIQREVEQKFGARLSAETLTHFLENLGRNGLLQQGQPGPEQGGGGRRRVRGSPLYLRLTAFDPDRLLTRMSGCTRFFFTRYFVAFSASVILLAACVAVLNWGEMNRDLHRLYRFDALILAALTLYAVTAAHEFAHGLTCKHFDAEVHEMGLLLLYFQPAFYCNVSDAWLLPRKSQRLWVTFAGAYFELFVCALATLIWRLVEPRTWLSSLSLIVMVTSAVKTFFNLNPLIKLDGYYLLSDYLEVPNLRSRSFAYLRTAIKRLLPGAHSQETSHSSRERRIYLGYGLLAGLYSYWLLGCVAVNFASFLTRRYQGFGFVMFTALLMTVFQSPISKGLRKGVGSAAPPAKGTGQFKRVTRVIIVLAFALAVLYFGRMELSVSSEFKVLPSTNAEVRAEIEGIIDEIYVDEGAVVKKGDPIARLSDRDLRAELQIIEASLAEKSAKLKLLLAGARPEEIELARRAVETARTRRESAHSRYEEARRIQAEGLSKSKAGLAKAKERLTYASGYLEDARLLFQSKLISRQEVDKAREEAAVRGKELEQAESEMKMILADDLADVQRLQAVAEKELEEALGKLALLLAGSRPEEIEATRAEIANQEARRHHLREQLQLMKVTSPIAGVITTPKLKQRIRQLVTKGDLIATVHQLKTVTAEIVSSEREIADVQVGQRVTLKARAYPEGSFTGNVTSIAPIATKDEEGMGDRYVLVSCQIDNPSLMLKSDMTGKAKIYCGQRRIIDLLSRRIARYIRIEFWSWW